MPESLVLAQVFIGLLKGIVRQIVSHCPAFTLACETVNRTVARMLFVIGTGTVGSAASAVVVIEVAGSKITDVSDLSGELMAALFEPFDKFWVVHANASGQPVSSIILTDEAVYSMNLPLLTGFQSICRTPFNPRTLTFVTVYPIPCALSTLHKVEHLFQHTVAVLTLSRALAHRRKTRFDRSAPHFYSPDATNYC